MYILESLPLVLRSWMSRPCYVRKWGIYAYLFVFMCLYLPYIIYPIYSSSRDYQSFYVKSFKIFHVLWLGSM